MEKIHALRLTYLAWFLDSILPPKFFDLRAFIKNNKLSLNVNNVQRLRDQILNGTPECGTTACALGWCPYVFPGVWTLVNDMPELVIPPDEYCMPYEWRDIEAGWFGLEKYAELDYLFYAQVDRTAKEESMVIKEVLSNHGFNYDELLEEAKQMFGPERAVHPVCSTPAAE